MTDKPGRRRAALLVIVSTLLGAALGFLVSAGRRVESQWPPAPPARPEATAVEQARPAPPPRYTSAVSSCVVALLLLSLGMWLLSMDRLLSAEIVVTVAVAVVVVALRGPVRRRWWAAVAVLVVLAVVAVSFDLLLIVIMIMDSVTDVGGLLAQVGLFIVVIGAFAWLATSWGLTDLAEGTALLLIALMLGFVSFSGISSFTAPLSAPQTDNSTLVVFAADPATEMEVIATYSLVEVSGTTLLSIQVRTIGSADHRWGIVLTGGLRFKPGEGNGRGVVRTDSPDGYQVLTGSRDLGDSYGGEVAGTFQASFASRSVVSLPRISSSRLVLSHFNDLAATEFAAVTPRSLTLSVDCGVLDPLKTVTQATPPLAVPNQLSWRGENELGPITYATFDQGDEDRSRNVLFVAAILLGAAVASLVAALQVLLRATRTPAG